MDERCSKSKERKGHLESLPWLIRTQAKCNPRLSSVEPSGIFSLCVETMNAACNNDKLLM
jgi:hypothetical protein